MCSRKCWIVSFFYFFLHLPHRQFSFIDLCLSSKMYWTFNCSWDNVMKWNVFFFCVLHIFQNFPCTLGEKSKSVSFSRVYVCVKAKLTLVSFFLLFFHAPSPKEFLKPEAFYDEILLCKSNKKELPNLGNPKSWSFLSFQAFPN